jgi:beta-lactam-binding protein with PASTA domain
MRLDQSDHLRRSRRIRPRYLALVGVATMVILAGCSSASAQSPAAAKPSSVSGQLLSGSTHSTINAHGQLTMPLPRLASDVSVTHQASGSATVSFALTYGVANTRSSRRVRADDATVVVRVARQLLPGGASPADPVFTKGFVDNHLNQASTTHRYSVTIPAVAVSFLKSKGLAFVKSKTGTTTTTVPSSTPAVTDALQLITVDVQQHRDFKRVDGSYDWTEGNSFTAASHPLATATTPGGNLTVNNDTAQICTYANSGSVTNYGDPDSFNNCTSSNMATPVQLSGVATQCFNTNTSSDPAGFAQENSSNVGQPLAPGASVTEPVEANDGISPFSAATESANAGWAVSLGKAVVTTAVNVLAGGPFGTIIEGTMELGAFITGTSCANDPNVMTLSATDTSGAAGASYGWAIDEEGMQDVYSTNFGGGTIAGGSVVNTAVQLAYSSQVYDNNGSYLNPWLAEQVTANCGVGSGSSSSSCPGGSTNSEMNVQWSTNNPCPSGLPYTFNGAQQAGNPKNCAGTVPTSPAVSNCGTNNTTCPSQTPPQPANVPNVIGQTYSQATSTLAAVGLGIYPTTMSPTAIIGSQTPQATAAGFGSGIVTPYVVQVSTSSTPPPGPPVTVTVPNVVGEQFCGAQGSVAQEGLFLESETTNSTCTQTILTQVPAAGSQAAVGSNLDVTTNAPPPPTTTTTVPPPSTTTTTYPTVVVPNVIGQTFTQATATLQAVGLGATNPDGDPVTDIVNGQNPSAGLTLDLGQNVVLTYDPYG